MLIKLYLLTLEICTVGKTEAINNNHSGFWNAMTSPRQVHPQRTVEESVGQTDDKAERCHAPRHD